MSQAGSYVDFDQIFSVLQGEGRKRLRQLVQGLGGAVRGSGDQLNALLGNTSSALTYASNVIQVTAKDTPSVSRLVEQLGYLGAAVGERDAAIKRIADDGLTTLDTIALRNAALRSILGALPSVLDQVRTTTDTVNHVTDTATPVVSNLAAALADLRPAASSLQPAVDQGRNIIQGLSSSAPGLEQTLTRATALAKPTPQALPQIKRTLCQANPMIRFLKPYTDDIIALIVGLGSASNSYDRFSHLIRLAPIIGDNSLVGLPTAVSQAAYTLIHTGLLTKTSGLSYQPYSPPGQIGRESATGQNMLGPAQFANSGYKYPHVVADC
jgi:ABC-type transporter Mla subunit MlaD